jgi:hypothetical protein
MSFFGGYVREARHALPVFATEPKAFFDVYPELPIAASALTAMTQLRTGAVLSAPIADQLSLRIDDKGCVLALAAGVQLSRTYHMPQLPVQYLTGGVILLWIVGLVAVLVPALRGRPSQRPSRAA